MYKKHRFEPVSDETTSHESFPKLSLWFLRSTTNLVCLKFRFENRILLAMIHLNSYFLPIVRQFRKGIDGFDLRTSWGDLAFPLPIIFVDWWYSCHTKNDRVSLARCNKWLQYVLGSIPISYSRWQIRYAGWLLKTLSIYEITNFELVIAVTKRHQASSANARESLRANFSSGFQSCRVLMTPISRRMHKRTFGGCAKNPLFVLAFS